VHSRYFDDFKTGDKYVTGARTVTEADVMSFCGLAGIFNPLFVDEEYARENSVFGTRVVPAPLTYILSIGMWMRLGFFERSALALLGVREMHVLAPVRHGDTLHAQVEIIETRQTKKSDRGIIEARQTTVNQKGEKVLDMVMTYMIKCR